MVLRRTLQTSFAASAACSSFAASAACILPNSSADRRVTLNAGFFPRARVQDVTVTHLDGRIITFDTALIRERSRMIAIGIDARRQRFPDEKPYHYRPLADQQDENRWCEETRRDVVKDYNVSDMYI